MCQEQSFIWKNSLGGSINWVGQSLWGSPRRVKQCQPGWRRFIYGTSLSAVWRWGLEKGQWPLFSLMPDTSVSPIMLLVPFKILPQCWSSEAVSLSRVDGTVCVFFRRNYSGLQPFLPLTQSLLGFIARGCRSLSSWHWIPGLEVLVWDWVPLFPRYPSWIFIHHTWVFYVCTPPTRPYGCGFFNSAVVRFQFNLISNGSERWFFYILVIILMWLCEEAIHVCLWWHLDWKWPAS